MGNINPYSVVAVRKRKREPVEQVLWWTKLRPCARRINASSRAVVYLFS